MVKSNRNRLEPNRHVGERIVMTQQPIDSQTFDFLADGIFTVGQDYVIRYMNESLKKSCGDGTGKLCYQHFQGNSKPCSFCKNDRVFAGETVRWEWKDRNGRIFDLIDTPFVYPDGTICKIGVLRDITETRKKEEKEKADLQTDRALMANLIELSQDGICLIDKDGIIRSWNKGAENILGYTSKEVLGRYMSIITSGEKQRSEQQAVVKELARKGSVRYTAHRVGKGDRQVDIEITATAIRNSSGESAMLVDFRDVTERNKLLKALELKESQLRQIVEKRLEAQEEERWRISRELHDGVGQSLSALKVALVSIRDAVSPKNAQKLDRAIEIISHSLGELRRISQDLRPPMLDDLGFVSAVYWLIDRFNQMCDIRVSFFPHSFPKNVPKQVELALFRVIQEALTNIVRHSQAEQANILLKETDRSLQLRIFDNGIGFDQRKVFENKNLEMGIGLVNMRERIQMLGGDLSIRSKPGEGSTISVKVPIKGSRKLKRVGRAGEPHG